MDIPIKVINLRRSVERREAFTRANGHVEFEFVEAVDGKALTQQQLRDPRLFVQPLSFPSAGAYGCALSHRKLWELAIEQGRPVTAVEDDVFLRHDFRQESAAVISRLPPDWDIVVWGWNFDTVLSLAGLRGISPLVLLTNQDMLRASMGAFQASMQPSFPLALDRTLGTPAYTITPAGARKFLQECFPMRHFQLHFPYLNRSLPNTGIDMSMARVYAAMHSFVAFPPLAATPNERGRSTVQGLG